MHHTILVAACRRGREKTFKSEKNTSLSLEKKDIQTGHQVEEDVPYLYTKNNKYIYNDSVSI